MFTGYSIWEYFCFHFLCFKEVLYRLVRQKPLAPFSGPIASSIYIDFSLFFLSVWEQFYTCVCVCLFVKLHKWCWLHSDHEEGIVGLREDNTHTHTQTEITNCFSTHKHPPTTLLKIHPHTPTINTANG